ncbi:MAG: hypothetical protein R3C56_41380 [Pirellulaceae bacterium]
MEGAGEELLVILAVGLAFVLGYLAAIVCLWFLMRRLSRRAAIIRLGIALFMHAVPLVAVLFEIPQHPGQVGETIRRILPDAARFPFAVDGSTECVFVTPFAKEARYPCPLPRFAPAGSTCTTTQLPIVFTQRCRNVFGKTELSINILRISRMIQ